nr:MAG TPA: hypothetical protein [Caudoviricetes sp.]
MELCRYLMRRRTVKHNGLANLFLGFIYGGSFTYVHTFVDDLLFRIVLMSAILALEFGLACFLYDFVKD